MRYLILLAILQISCSYVEAKACTSSFVIQGDTVRYCGNIDSEFSNALFKIVEEQHIEKLAISSTGGDVAEAIDTAKMLNNNSIKLVVTSECLSACATFLLMMTENVEVEQGTAIGFHENPAGTLSIMLASGVIQDINDEMWNSIRLHGLNAFTAYDNASLDKRFLVESVLGLNTSCLHSLVRAPSDEEKIIGFRVRRAYNYWVPTRSLVDDVRMTKIKGWWPADHSEAVAGFVSLGYNINSKRITYSDVDKPNLALGLVDTNIPICG